MARNAVARNEPDADSPALKVMAMAYSQIVADVRSGGPWAQRVAKARSPLEGIIGNAYFDAPTRKPTVLERIRRLEPRPVTAGMDWLDDRTIVVYSFGLPDEQIPFRENLIVDPDALQDSASALTELISEALLSIDPQATDALKVIRRI